MKIKQGYQNYIVAVSEVNVVMTAIHYSQAVLLTIFETLIDRLHETFVLLSCSIFSGEYSDLTPH